MVIRVVLNVIWLLFGGIVVVVVYALLGLLLLLLIITAPFGIACLRIAGFALWPFGRTIEVRRDAGIPSLIGAIIWVVLAGWWLAVGHVVHGILLCLTIIGIPLGLASFKAGADLVAAAGRAHRAGLTRSGLPATTAIRRHRRTGRAPQRRIRPHSGRHEPDGFP